MQVSPAPTAVRVAGAIVGAQGLAGLGFAIAVLVRAFSGASTPGNNLFGEAVYFALLGAGIVTCGVGLILGRRWARGPVVVVQILLIGVAWYALGPSHRPELGIPVGALCILVLVLLFVGRSRAWSLGLDDREPES